MSQSIRTKKIKDEVYANMNDLIIKLMVEADDAATDLETQAIKKVVNLLTTKRDEARKTEKNI